MSLERDLKLVASAPAVFDNVAGLAGSMNALLGARHSRHPLNEASIKAAKEIGERYTSLVLAVAPSVLEYRENMSEEELRRWATSLILTLR